MKKLSELIANTSDVEIITLMVDSREKVEAGMFFCLKGLLHDGHKYVSQAIENGAICIVHSDELPEYSDSITYVQVDDVLACLNLVADAFYDHPSKKMNIYGVTGTNGKSTIAYTIYSILNQLEPAGYVGTISVEYAGKKQPPSLTTPDIITLQKILQQMVQAKTKDVALEVSSHGLEQNRVASVDFDVAIFTNLTHDHLDFHGTMENYYEAKKKLFTMLDPTKIAVINIDDSYGAKLASETNANVVTYGIEKEAIYRAINIQLFSDKTIFTLAYFGEQYEVETNFVAEFNIYNLLAVIAALHQTGMSLDQIIERLKHLKQVDGRMEKITEGQPFNVIVDYAHTPDGFEKIYAYAKSITPEKNRIISVFGCAGKRDLKKRPILGEISSKYCDMIVLTEEDPRGESVVEICEEIAGGITSNYIIVEDRYDAIHQAIEIANSNDTILILGKGDEDYMYREFGREYWMGDDEAARVVLKNLLQEESER